MLKWSKGFSLIESVVVLSLMVILIGLGGAASSKWLAKQRADIFIAQLAQAITLARYTAVTQGLNVSLCPSMNATTCTKDWNNGYLVFLDNQGQHQPESSQSIIRYLQILPKGSRLIWQSFPKVNYLTFTYKGTTQGQNGTFIYDSANQDSYCQRSIIISKSGRLRLVNNNSAPFDS